MKHNTLYKLSMSIIVFSMIFLAYLYYLAFFPFKTIEIKNLPFKVDQLVVEPGETITYEVDYCKYTDRPAEVIHSFVDGFTYSLPVGQSNLPKGCGVTRLGIVVPETINPGRYRINTTLTYKLNPLRNDTVSLGSQYFEVVKK